MQGNKKEATGMREKAWDGGREGTAYMCEKIARESMLPIMQLKVVMCVKIDRDAVGRERGSSPVKVASFAVK